jgi:hypothetical protein
VHHLLLHCHQRVNRHPSITEQSQFLQPVPYQNTIVLDVHKHHLGQPVLLIAPAQQRGREIALVLRDLNQYVLTNKYLLYFQRVPVVASVRQYSSSWQLIVANNISNALSLSMIAFPQGLPHLLPEIFNLQRLECGLNKL